MRISYGDFTIESDDLSDRSLAYLLQYGLTQSLSDVIAGMAKKLRDDGADDEFIANALHQKQVDRFEKILSGEITAGNIGPRAKGLDKVMNEVAEDKLKAVFAAQKRAWPTGKGSAAQINNLVARYVEKYRKDVEREARDRMAAQAKAAESVDLDELLA